MSKNNLLNNIENLNCNNYINNINDIIEINKNIIELNSLIDKKNINLQDCNDNYNNKIILYKSMLENIILEYHNSCKELFRSFDN